MLNKNINISKDSEGPKVSSHVPKRFGIQSKIIQHVKKKSELCRKDN